MIMTTLMTPHRHRSQSPFPSLGTARGRLVTRPWLYDRVSADRFHSRRRIHSSVNPDQSRETLTPDAYKRDSQCQMMNSRLSCGAVDLSGRINRRSGSSKLPGSSTRRPHEWPLTALDAG